MKHLDILFKSCLRSRTEDPRIVPPPKSNMIIRCLISLVNSIHYSMVCNKDITYRLVVHDDHSDKDFIDAMTRSLEECRCPVEIYSMPKGVTGHNPAMESGFNYIRENFGDLYFLIEDDYLHSPSTLYEMMRFYQHARKMVPDSKRVSILPVDSPWAYRAGTPYMNPSMIVLGENRHWRTHVSTATSCMMEKATMEKYWREFEKMMHYDEIFEGEHIHEYNTYDKIHRNELLFVPMPSLSCHLGHPNDNPPVPYLNWNKLFMDSIVVHKYPEFVDYSMHWNHEDIERINLETWRIE